MFVQIYTPTSSVWKFQFLHSLSFLHNTNFSFILAILMDVY